MSGVSLAERTIDSTAGPRVVPLEVARGYRDAAEVEHSVSFSRFIRCLHCARKGCERCEFVGWRVQETSANVVVPHGSTPGTRITIEGVGDDIDGGARSIIVEIVEPGPRADQLRAEQRDFESKLETAWQMDRTTRVGRGRRMRIVAGICGLVLLAIPVGRWFTKATVGEQCTGPADCRSGHCISLMTFPRPEAGSTTPRLEARLCSASCATDLDCPSSMECRVRKGEHGSQMAVDVPEGLACIPHGY